MEAVLQIIIRVLFFSILSYIAIGFIDRKIRPYRYSWDKMLSTSYKQTKVYVGGMEYLPGRDCYLNHNKRTGWTARLYGIHELIGSERYNKDFCITADGVAVIGKLPEEKEE